CRTSPPQGGRLDVSSAFANHQHRRKSAAGDAANLPLAGEMPGKAEGGAVPPTSDIFRFASAPEIRVAVCDDHPQYVFAPFTISQTT
ncbi:MAG: hypothetical protein E5W38_28930, partial [Mesorhizobium sp.]